MLRTLARRVVAGPLVPAVLDLVRAVGVIDELVSRCHDFHAGTEICLADHQLWTFPAPTEGWILPTLGVGGEYLGLIQAVREAEDHAEQRLAELTLAMFLLGQNYHLTPTDYQALFIFKPGSAELADSQIAFHDLAKGHIRFLVSIAVLPMPTPPTESGVGVLARVKARLRNQWPIRRFFSLLEMGKIAP